MSRHRWAILGLAILFGATLPALNGNAGDERKSDQVSNDSLKASPAKSAALPKLIDLGSKSCIPCRKMAPILDSLREEYRGKADIIFIDVREDREAALKHKITLIPTQIFFDKSGLEIYRHIGFFPADSITVHLKELGVEL
jgi:thioredoxin 1